MAMPFAIAAVALAGCSSPGPGSAASSAASSATGPAANRPAAAATYAPSCRTHLCIAGDMQNSLVGLIVKDESIVAKAACQPSTVQHHAGNTWTAKCTATYVNGTKVSRFAHYMLAKKKITFTG